MADQRPPTYEETIRRNSLSNLGPFVGDSYDPRITLRRYQTGVVRPIEELGESEDQVHDPIVQSNELLKITNNNLTLILLFVVFIFVIFAYVSVAIIACQSRHLDLCEIRNKTLGHYSVFVILILFSRLGLVITHSLYLGIVLSVIVKLIS